MGVKGWLGGLQGIRQGERQHNCRNGGRSWSSQSVEKNKVKEGTKENS